jgi:aminoglycoside phosphotransferase (APT) family kinase protein
MPTPVVESLRSDALESFLDDRGLGMGPVRATPIGNGASNLTYVLERDGARVVLRRPPPPPLPPSAHDVVREARIQLALAPVGVRVPRVLAVCEDKSVLGVPFYLMEELDGVVVSDQLPAAIDTPQERRQLGEELLDGLVQLHAVDWEACGLRIGKPTGYLERQLRRWSGLWELNATRELRICLELGERLRATAPDSPPSTVVHGDYRLGNVMVAAHSPARLIGILDWEMATVGDPLADLGYLIASWSEPRVPQHPLLLAPVTERPGFPTRAELVARYAERTGRDVSGLQWYEAFALWKAAVFCEAIYGRYLRGERADRWSGSLCDGVPRLLEVAAGYL